MIIKPAKYKKTKKTISVLVSQDIYGCDQCKKEIDMNLKDADYLKTTVFSLDGTSEHRIFCSWKCVIENLKKVKTDYFVSLPFVSYDKKGKGLRAEDLISLFK